MRFRRRFRVAAPLERVAEFHRHPSALKAISPPFPPVKILDAPDPLLPGSRMTLRIWFGPLPILWEAQLEEIEGVGFADFQLRGPFASWRHEHRFEAAEAEEGGAAACWVVDEIEAKLDRNPVLFVIGLKMWLGLPLLFAYRRWRTRRLCSS